MASWISLFKTMYQHRDLSLIDSVYHEIFRNSTHPLLLGTSNGEMCTTKEEVLELLTNDLKYWGDVSFEESNVVTTTYGAFQHVHIPAKVSMTFEGSEATYERYKGYVKEIIQSTKTSYQKAMMIQRLCDHVLSDRPHGKRTYQWDLSIDAIIDRDCALVFSYSMPIHSTIPDVRFEDRDPSTLKSFEIEQRKMRELFTGSTYTKLTKQIKERILLEQLADTVHLDKETLHVTKHDQHLFFVGIGTYQRTLTKEQRLNELLATPNDSASAKDFLFRIRRDITWNLLHDAQGETMTLPFRVFGIATLMNGTYAISMIKVVLPMNYIFEEKTNDAITTFDPFNDPQ